MAGTDLHSLAGSTCTAAGVGRPGNRDRLPGRVVGMAQFAGQPSRRKKGTGTICAQRPPGRSGKWCLSPFSPPGHFALLLVALWAAALVNPYGAALPLEWLQTVAMPLPGLMRSTRHQFAREPVGWATAALGVGYAAVLLGSLPGRPRVVWLLPLAWLVLAFARVRNAPLFAVTAVIAIGDMLPHSLFGRWLLAGPAEAPRTSREPCRRGPLTRGRRRLLLPLAVVGAAAAIQMFGLHVPVIGRGWARFDEAPLAHHLAAEPRCHPCRRRLAGRRPHLQRHAIWRLFDLLPAALARLCRRPLLAVWGRFSAGLRPGMAQDPAQIDRWRRQYGFRHALVESGGRFDKYLSAAPGWRLFRRSDAAALYQHR